MSGAHLVLPTSTEEHPLLEPGDDRLGVPKSCAGHGNTAPLLGLDVLGGCFCKGGRGCKRDHKDEGWDHARTFACAQLSLQPAGCEDNRDAKGEAGEGAAWGPVSVLLGQMFMEHLP